LKIELLRSFSTLDGVMLHPELGNVDIVLKRKEETAFIELKTFPTNYGGGGKPITNFINSVIVDLEKLEKKRADHSGAFVILAAYPIPIKKEQEWEKKMGAIYSTALTTLFAKKIQIGDTFAHIYFLQAK